MSTVEPFVVSADVRAAQDHESETCDALWSQSVGVLTRAAKLTRTFDDGHTEASDFAGFLASALAAVAANLGDVDRVTAGRSGSWEASLVDELVRNTVGPNQDDLLAHRTEPVVVPLNVGLLVEDSAGLVSFFDAEELLPFSLDVDEATREGDWDRLRAGYLTAYEDYAQRFTQAVQEHARTIPGLTIRSGVEGDERMLVVPVTVQVETSPDFPWTDVQNPVEWAGDPLVWHLWDHAVGTLGLPTLPDETRWSGNPPEAV